LWSSRSRRDLGFRAHHRRLLAPLVGAVGGDGGRHPPNNPSAASCFLASVDPAFPFRSLAGLGGEEGSGCGRDLSGSGRSWSHASLVRVRGAGVPPVAASSPSSPFLAGLGGEGSGDRVNKLLGSSVFFSKRGRCCSSFTAATSVHLAGLGGEGVALDLLRLAWGSAAATRGHRDGHAELVARVCASLLLFLRSSDLVSLAPKPPVRPSGFVLGRSWGGAGEPWQAISGMLGSDCTKAIFVRVLVAKVRDQIVIFFFLGSLCKIPTAE
jgi:hypothetical protein